GLQDYGAATGAPVLAAVPSATGMVDLFNSSSSAAGGVLSNQQNAGLFESYVKANLTLMRAASLPTQIPSDQTAKVASNLIGKNLAGLLTPQPADLTRYGITSATPTKLQAIAQTLITTFKAFKLNLTSSVLLPGMNDDPHGAFASPTTLASTV